MRPGRDVPEPLPPGGEPDIGDALGVFVLCLFVAALVVVGLVALLRQLEDLRERVTALETAESPPPLVEPCAAERLVW